MRKLSLDRAWKLCLEQWKWIIGELDKGSNIDELKDEWLQRRSYKYRPACGCFFCQYDYQEEGYSLFCDSCPGRLANNKLRKSWCEARGSNWYCNPRAFYRKIVALNKKRLEAK